MYIILVVIYCTDNIFILSQWPRGTNIFESNDLDNGAWVILDDVQSTGVYDYQLDIQAKRTACYMQGKTCSLQIFIATCTFNSSDQVELPKDGKQAIKNYLLINFKKIYDINFSDSNKFEVQSFNFSHTCPIVMLAMRARGISGEIHNITLYYYYCKETVVRSVMFLRTNAPLTGIKRVLANCTNNAVSRSNGSNIEGFCWYNGTWSFPNDMKCLCRPGYEALKTGCERK